MRCVLLGVGCAEPDRGTSSLFTELWLSSRKLAASVARLTFRRCFSKGMGLPPDRASILVVSPVLLFCFVVLLRMGGESILTA